MSSQGAWRCLRERRCLNIRKNIFWSKDTAESYLRWAGLRSDISSSWFCVSSLNSPRNWFGTFEGINTCIWREDRFRTCALARLWFAALRRIELWSQHDSIVQFDFVPSHRIRFFTGYAATFINRAFARHYISIRWNYIKTILEFCGSHMRHDEIFNDPIEYGGLENCPYL